ncbi:acetyltransferase (GNAT) family protein, partial [Biomphalaria glabrata]
IKFTFEQERKMLLTKYSKMSASIVPYSAVLCGGRSVVVDAMTKAQVHEMYTLVQDAAQAGLGFGADEYTDEEEFLEDIEDGFQFAVMDKDSGEMVAAFVLAVSKYSRGCLTADPFIVVKPNMRGYRLGSFCMTTCVKFAKELGFMGIYCDTFSNNTPMIKIVESLPGFQKVGCLPMGGLLKDGQIVGTEIYYKDLRNDQG